MVKIAKIDPLNIPDPLWRGMFYREIRRPLEDWARWEVSIDESLRPDLIAQRFYGSARFKTIVGVAAELDDYRQAIPAGTVIALPPIVWIRQRIKFYAELSPPDLLAVTREDVAEPVVIEPPAPVRTVKVRCVFPDKPARKTKKGLPNFARLSNG